MVPTFRCNQFDDVRDSISYISLESFWFANEPVEEYSAISPSMNGVEREIKHGLYMMK